MEIKSILLGIAVLVILIVLYYWLFSDSSVSYLVTTKDGTIFEIIDGTKIQNSANFSYNLWLFLKDFNYNYGNKKIILFRPFCSKEGETECKIGGSTYDYAATSNSDASDAACYYKLEFDKHESTLIFSIASKKNISGSTTDIGTQHTTCKIENFPLQKWTHVLITHRNQAIDIYIDGKLAKTCVMDKAYFVPSTPTPLFLSPGKSTSATNYFGTTTVINDHSGFSGYISNLQHYTRAIQPREAYALYKAGYSSGGWLSDLFNKYKLKIAFMENKKEINSFLI
jgi:hypothetical protein